MSDQVFVARVTDEEGATYAYVFQLNDGETPLSAAKDIAQSLADCDKRTLIEVMLIEDFMNGDVYELCTV